MIPLRHSGLQTVKENEKNLVKKSDEKGNKRTGFKKTEDGD